MRLKELEICKKAKKSESPRDEGFLMETNGYLMAQDRNNRHYQNCM